MVTFRKWDPDVLRTIATLRGDAQLPGELLETDAGPAAPLEEVALGRAEETLHTGFVGTARRLLCGRKARPLALTDPRARDTTDHRVLQEGQAQGVSCAPSS